MSKFRTMACALAIFPLSTLAFGITTAAAADPEVSITITGVRALDRPDTFSKGDFYARVTINGETVATQPVKQETSITPNWVISRTVKPGKVDVKLAILDKDVSVDDPIDINRIADKRDLDFTIDTRTCKIDGFASTYRCKQTISRAGKEKKAAEASFTVTVKK